jgi:hypothetical protein
LASGLAPFLRAVVASVLALVLVLADQVEVFGSACEARLNFARATAAVASSPIPIVARLSFALLDFAVTASGVRGHIATEHARVAVSLVSSAGR